MLAALSGRSSDARRLVERALRLAEENIPVEAIVMDAREGPDESRHVPFADDVAEVAEMLREAHRAMIDAGTEAGLALRALATIEPFESHPEVLQTYKEEIER